MAAAHRGVHYLEIAPRSDISCYVIRLHKQPRLNICGVQCGVLNVHASTAIELSRKSVQVLTFTVASIRASWHPSCLSKLFPFAFYCDRNYAKPSL